MKTLKPFMTTILASILLLPSSSAFIYTQNMTRFNNATNHLADFKLKNMNVVEAPIHLLVIDGYSHIKPGTLSFLIKKQTVNSPSGLDDISLAKVMEPDVEIEEEMNLEDWMLNPYFAENNMPEYPEAEEEETMIVEPWMTDVSLW